MLFNSYEFLFVFLPITWIVFRVLSRISTATICCCWLLFASLVFYGWFNYQLLGLLFFSLGFNYALACLNTNRFGDLTRRWILGGGIAVNVALIGYFKYSGFAVGVLDQALQVRLEWSDPILPLAISFYTFEQIAFLVGCYRDNGRTPRFLHYCFFICFFPQLIAGPILHYSEIVPQVDKQKFRVTATQLSVGLTLVALGLAKKVLIADELGGYFQRAHDVFVEGYSASLLEAWASMTSAALQIYFDYSGYADVAIGLALLFGLKLPLNFFSPYKAVSIAGFWRNWNMTLMRFLRNHLYIPLGGNRHGRWRQGVAILVTMIVCGFWHGAGWNFLVWGAIVGSILAAEVAFAKPVQASLAPSALRVVAGRAFVFCAYVVPLSFFLFSDVADGGRMAASLLGFNGVGIGPGWVERLSTLGIDAVALGIPVGETRLYFGREQLAYLALALAIVYLCPNCYQLVARFRPVISTPGLFKPVQESRVVLRWRPTLPWAAICAILFCMVVVQMRNVEEYFYFQF